MKPDPIIQASFHFFDFGKQREKKLECLVV